MYSGKKYKNNIDTEKQIQMVKEKIETGGVGEADKTIDTGKKQSKKKIQEKIDREKNIRDSGKKYRDCEKKVEKMK